MNKQCDDKLIVVFTGPESTGKTTLSQLVSQHYNAKYIAEYAREYVEGLSRPYTYDDVVNIARYQINTFNEALNSSHEIIICDTFLIITKVWFQEVYHRVPVWLEEFLSSIHIDLHLLCQPDIPWLADDVRENGDNRSYLYSQYLNELEKFNFAYCTIEGKGQERIKQAINHINQFK